MDDLNGLCGIRWGRVAGYCASAAAPQPSLMDDTQTSQTPVGLGVGVEGNLHRPFDAGVFHLQLSKVSRCPAKSSVNEAPETVRHRAMQPSYGLVMWRGSHAHPWVLKGVGGTSWRAGASGMVGTSGTPASV